MARQQGTLKINSNIENGASAPLDARAIVPTKADLTVASNFPYSYVGMLTSVQSEGIAYILVGADTTNIANWKPIGSDTGQIIQVDTMPTADSEHVDVIYQYIGDTDSTYTNGYFYKCVEDATASPSTFSWENIPVQEAITVDSAIDSTSANPVENQVIAAELDKKQDVIQYAVMPIADSTIEGKIVQFVGITTSTYHNGYFYKCVESSETAGTYLWIVYPVTDAIPSSEKGAANGVAELDASGLVPASQLPSYVDDVIEGYYNTSDGKFYEEDTYTTEIVGEAGKIYIDLTNTPATATYRWSGSAFYKITDEDLKIQFTTMPTAADYVGKIIQYTGTTTAEYTSGYFYEGVEDSENPGTYIWQAVSVQEGGGSGGELGINITAAIDVGGIDAGTSYTAGTSYDALWNDLLNPVLYPTFTAPSASLSYSSDAYYEVGSTIAAKTATLTYNPGAITLNGVKQNNRGGAATNYALASSGADTDYSGSSASSGTFSVTALTRSTKGAVTLTGTVSYAQGPQPLDSKGNNYGSPEPAGSKTSAKTMNFIQAYFYGVSNTSTISDFTGLTKSVTAKGQKTFSFTTSNQYMVFAYDSSYGALSSILDSNGFETISGWNRTTVTINGFSYYVYIPQLPTTDTAAAFTFKY